MADKEYRVEEVKCQVERPRLAWVTMLAVGGGVVGLLSAVISKIILGFGGVFLLGFLTVWSAQRDRKIQQLIARLKEV